MKKPYVAIVDDDAGFAQYLRTFLSLRGYEARCYTRGDELLASMKQAEAPDVVLLDVMMPGLDGMATLRALKASRPEAQVIMLSGRNQASTIVEAVRLGAADYVVKPDDPEGLGEIALDVAIKNAIEKNRLVSELSGSRTTKTGPSGATAKKCAGSRLSSNRWPTATSASSSAARAVSARSSCRAPSISDRRGATVLS
jgi:DNA-binding response OmpR family regulator